MLINDSEQDHYDARKQSLIQQILSYTFRIQQYQTLENQLKSIYSFIDKSKSYNSYSSSPSTSKNASRKSLDQVEKKPLQVKKDPHERRTSSSKKIKLYELQKKLARLTKDYNQKFSSLISQKRQHQVTLQTINQISMVTQKQNLQLKELQNQDSRLVEQLLVKSTEYLKAKKELEQVCAKKDNYQFQKQSLLDKIETQKKSHQNLKKLIGLMQSETKGNLLNMRQKQKHEKKKNDQNALKFNMNEQKLKEHQQISSEDESNSQIYCNKGNGQDKKINNFEVEGVIYNIIDSNNSLEQKYKLELQPKILLQKLHSLQQINETKSFQQDSNIFSLLKDKMQIVESQNCQLNEQILKVKKEMVSIETQIKHHRTSIQLLKQKINMKNLFIEREKTKHLNNLSSIQQTRKLLSEKQGQRGQMRGRIGTRVDQQGILKLINITLQKDLDNLKQKKDCLVVFRNMLSAQIVHFK